MVLELIFAIVILAIVIYIVVRVVHSIAFGILLIGLVFIASLLIMGSFPNLKNTPVIGEFFPFLPSNTTDAIAIIKDVFFNIDIVGTTRDADNNLLVTVANTGKFDVSGFKAFVDNTTVIILNKPKDPLKSREITTIQTDWKAPFSSILVTTKDAKVAYNG